MAIFPLLLFSHFSYYRITFFYGLPAADRLFANDKLFMLLSNMYVQVTFFDLYWYAGQGTGSASKDGSDKEHF
jgi:hypothetical protein